MLTYQLYAFLLVLKPFDLFKNTADKQAAKEEMQEAYQPQKYIPPDGKKKNIQPLP